MADTLDARPFKQLLRYVVRAFYSGRCPPLQYIDGGEEGAGRLSKINTEGLGVILMDYMLEREWVGEEQLCQDLGQHHKIVRRALKFLEHEHILMSHSQRETRRSQKRDIVKHAVEAKQQQLQQLQEVQEQADEEEEAPQKQHTFSYWAVDFPRAFDMIQLRLLQMRRVLKDELDSKEVVAKYQCTARQCNKEYDSFDITDIIQPDGTMICAICQGAVEQVLATGQLGDEEERKARRERLGRLLKDVERQLEPITKLVGALRHTQPPHHGTITEWALLQKQRAAEGTLGGPMGPGAAADARARLHGGVTQLTEAGGAARNAAYAQETHVQVTFAPTQEGGAAAGGASGSGVPWTRPATDSKAAGGSSKAPPSIQPFFLRKSGGGGGDVSGTPPPDGSAAGYGLHDPANLKGTTPPDEDEYTKKMLAAMGQGGAGAGGLPPGSVSPLEGPAAKRVKVEEAGGLQDVKPDTEPGQAADDEEEEWEDI